MKGKKAKGGSGYQKVMPKKDMMAKNVSDHMGGGTMGKKVPVKKSGGKSK